MDLSSDADIQEKVRSMVLLHNTLPQRHPIHSRTISFIVILSLQLSLQCICIRPYK